jgi:hypothetical protein
MRINWIIFYAGKVQAVRSSEKKAKKFIAFQKEHQPGKVDIWYYEAWLVE